MKRNNLKKMNFAFVLLFCVASLVSAKGDNNLSIFYYNNTGAKSLSPMQIVCVADEGGKFLSPHLKYLFTYDKEDRVVRKEAFRWNPYVQKWICDFHLKLTYTDNAITLEYANWDTAKNVYEAYTEKIVYQVENNQLSACWFYKRDEDSDSWRQIAYLDKKPMEMLWAGNLPLLAKTH